MKKVVLTEQQVNNLMNKVVNEQLPVPREADYTMDDGRYHMKCTFSFENNEYVVYKGGEIDDIESVLGEVTFLIDIEHVPFGIKGMKIIDIRGPKEIKSKIRFYPEGTSSQDEDWWNKRQDEEVMIPLNWKKIEVDDDGYKMDYIGVSSKINVILEPDGNGGLRGGKIEVTTKNFTGED